MSEQHAIDGAVLIYLTLDDGKWMVDFPTIDGHPLDVPEKGIVNDRCACGDAGACERAREAAGLIPMPTGIELADMLSEAVRRQSEDPGDDGEVWRAVPDFVGLYEVSSFGRVRSFNRHRKARVLKPMTSGTRNPFVVLCNGRSPSVPRHEREHRMRVDELVLTAFVRSAHGGERPAHVDKDATNNRLENLKWTTL
jgi:hypothetical protein